MRHSAKSSGRNYAECPEGLYKYWMGHAGRDMSDLYDKVKEDVVFRRKWAERCGFGFELLAVVPNVPKIVQNSASARARASMQAFQGPQITLLGDPSLN